MANLKFANTYNMVTFLAKPAESEGFEQIVDFLNAHTIMDGKKIIITKSIVRRDLQLEDAEGVDCLPNATIFEQLTLMGYEKISQKLTFYKAFFSPQWKFLIHTILQCLSSKTTAWNEFSSTMASAIICLATNQKFNFSKYIFESMVKNLDNVGKFLMYPRFVQVFVNQQLDGLPSHKRIYVTPSHTKKIFGNMKRVGKGFSGRVTPLFPTMVVHNQEEMGEGSAMPTDPHHTPTIIQPSTSQPQKTQKPRRPKRKDIEVPQPSGPTTNVADEAVNKEMDDSLVRATTTVSSLEAEQDSGNIDKTRSKATPNEPSSPGTSSGGGPRRQETIWDTIGQTRSENVSKISNDPLLARVLNLETTKTTQANEIASLKRREDASKQGRIPDIDANKDIYLVNVYTDEDMFGVNDLDGDEVIVDNVDVVKTAEETRSMVEEVTTIIEKAKLVSTAEEIVNATATTVNTASTIPVSAATTTTTTTTTVSDVEITLAQTLAELKSAKPKADKVVIQEPEQGATTTTLTKTVATTITTASTRPKVKGIVIHEQEQAPTPTVSSQQPSLVKVQDKGKGKMLEPEPVTKMSKKDLLRLDEELAFKLQAEKEEKRLAREKAQQIEKPNIAWDDVQAKIEADYQLAQRLQAQEQEELTDEERKDYLTKLVEENSKKAEVEIAQERSSKRAEEELEQEKEVAIDAIPLATKPPTIVDWKIHKEGKNNYYQIIRADGSSKKYKFFSQMPKGFDRQDLEDLYKLVKDKYGSTRPVEDLDLILYGDLKTMFDPHVEDKVWRNQQDYRVLDSKIYDSCRVHSLRMQHVYIHMLVKKRYPLTPATIIDMLNKKLQCDHFSKMVGADAGAVNGVKASAMSDGGGGAGVSWGVERWLWRWRGSSDGGEVMVGCGGEAVGGVSGAWRRCDHVGWGRSVRKRENFFGVGRKSIGKTFFLEAASWWPAMGWAVEDVRNEGEGKRGEISVCVYFRDGNE
ncbi:hypothetical protein Tco_1253018 [Tanacetum coccineum]